MKQATITIACNILQNTAVVRINPILQEARLFPVQWLALLLFLDSNFSHETYYRHKNKEALQMASL
jgi:hypothetical protein